MRRAREVGEGSALGKEEGGTPERGGGPQARPAESGPVAGSVGDSVTGHPAAGGQPAGGTGRAWAELLRVSALFTVPGDLVAGAAAGGHRPGRGTLLAACSSLCLYEAGMALNDWADRDTDAVERPGRPIPSGRIAPGAALAAAGSLTAAGLVLAAAAGRPARLTATALAATVWAYDLRLKHTAAGPAAMACARALDLLQGAVAGRARWSGPSGGGRAAASALPAAALLGAHTLAVTTVSRREAQGSSAALPLGGLAAVAAVAGGALAGAGGRRGAEARTGAGGEVRAALLAGYAATAARPLLPAVLNPSPYFLQRAVGGGIRAMIPLQAALAARAGAPRTGAALLALIPAARRLSRKVSPT